jgi:hypothetical protein
MALLESTDHATEDVPPAAAGAGLRVAAISLWGVVGTLLGYGVLQTVIKASALFG